MITLSWAQRRRRVDRQSNVLGQLGGTVVAAGLRGSFRAGSVTCSDTGEPGTIASKRDWSGGHGHAPVVLREGCSRGGGACLLGPLGAGSILVQQRLTQDAR